MKGRLFLVHWKESEAEGHAEAMRAAGWIVGVESEDGARAGKRIKEDLPDAVVIYLNRLPSHGRVTAAYLQSLKATREVPIVFVDGDEAARQRTRAKLPLAIFTTSPELEGVLERVLQAADVV